MQYTDRHNHAAHPVHPAHQLQLEKLSVQRGRDIIISDISFTVSCGDIVALIGPNGGGKSTLLKALTGEWPYQGTIRFQDRDGKALPKPCIGYMPQQLLFDRQAPLTVADILGAHQCRWPVFLGVRQKTRKKLKESLQRVHAQHLLDRRLGDLSGGELQRVTLAFALDPVPDILLLDEPASALDETGKALFYQLVKDLREQYDLLTLIVSHDLDVITAYANRLIYLNKTIITEGPIDQVMAGDPPWLKGINPEMEDQP